MKGWMKMRAVPARTLGKVLAPGVARIYCAVLLKAKSAAR
jgi:hypothetical protein